MEQISKKTVILVDEIYLAKQWCNYILENTDLPPEKLVMVNSKMKKADKERIKTASVIVASKDSLFGKAKLTNIIKEDCGLIIIDEVHVVAAKIFTEVAKEFDAKWVLGLTASAERDDGLSFQVHAIVGEILIKADIFDSIKLGSSILPLLRPIYLKKTYDHEITDKMHYAEIAKIAMLDPGAITTLAIITKTHYDNNDVQLVITQRIEESHYLKKCLVAMGIPESKIGTVLGDSSLDERETVIKKIETGEINVVISSKIFDKGVSANKINVLHNYFPTKEVANTINFGSPNGESR